MDEVKQKLIDKEMERVLVVKSRLVIKHPFWAYLLLPTRLCPTFALPSFAATDGISTIWINPAWTVHLTYPQLAFVLIHELSHIAYLSGARRGGRELGRWQASTDLRINFDLAHLRDSSGERLYVMPTGVQIPNIGPVAPLYEEWVEPFATEEIYERLPQEMSLNFHTGRGTETGEQGEPDWTHLPGYDGQTCYEVPAPLSQDAAERVIERVLAAYEMWRASQQRGELPGSLVKWIERLKAARVPWERVLHQYATECLAKDDFRLSPPHRKWLMYDIIRPSLRSETLGQLVVHVDSSGSTQAVLEEFAAEVAKLAYLAEDTLLIIGDAAVQQVVKTAELPQFLSRVQFKGGGGTSHLPIFDYLKQNGIHPDLFISLTDLVSAFPEVPPGFPVIWCAPQEQHGNPPRFGQVVLIPKRDKR